MQPNTKLIISSPCHANWNKMSPTEQGKFCQSCSKEVVDFSKKDKTEIIDYLQNYKGEGQTCGKFSASQIDKVGTNYINSNWFKRAKISFIALLGFLSFKESKAQKMGKVALKGTVSYKDWNEENQKTEVMIYGSVRNRGGDKISGAVINFEHERTNLGSTKTIANGTFAVKLKIDKSMKAIIMKTYVENYEMKYNVIPEPQKEKIKVDIVMEDMLMIMGEIAIDIDTIKTEDSTYLNTPEKDTISCTKTLVDTTETPEPEIIEPENIPQENLPLNDTISHKTDWIDDKNFLKIHPNPANTSTLIEWKDDDEVTVEVFDLTGKSVWKTKAKGNKVVFNSSILSNGHYEVVITSILSEKRQTAALIISH